MAVHTEDRIALGLFENLFAGLCGSGALGKRNIASSNRMTEIASRCAGGCRGTVIDNDQFVVRSQLLIHPQRLQGEIDAIEIFEGGHTDGKFGRHSVVSYDEVPMGIRG